MSILEELTKKPWLADPSQTEGATANNTFFMPAGKVGLRVFLVVVTVVFLLTTIAYGDRMLFANWNSMPAPWVLWLNTCILVGSSFALQWA